MPQMRSEISWKTFKKGSVGKEAGLMARRQESKHLGHQSGGLHITRQGKIKDSFIVGVIIDSVRTQGRTGASAQEVHIWHA